MSTTKRIVGVLIALLGISALNWQTSAVAQAPSGAAYAADGRIILADSASDRARQEAQRREEQRREEEQRRREEQRREQEQRRQEEQRQRAEEKRKDEAAAEQKRKDEAAEQKRKDQAAVEQKRKEELAAEQRRREADSRATDQKHREEQAAEQRRREVDSRAADQRRREAESHAVEQKKAAVPKASEPVRPAAAPIHNGSIPDRNNKGLSPQGSLPAVRNAPLTVSPPGNGTTADSQGGYADRRYAGPNGRLPAASSTHNSTPASSVNVPKAGNAGNHVGNTPTAGKESNMPNWGPATGGPTPLTTNRGTPNGTAAGKVTGATAGSAAGAAASTTSAPKTKEEKLAADQATKKAEQAAQQQAEQEYLKKVAAGVKLVATKCPDNEGHYYATGSMPKIRPEVVGCIDVHYQAICPGSRIAIEGVAKNFIGMSGCFGDTYQIAPKPACAVKDVQIRVVDVRPGCSGK